MKIVYQDGIKDCGICCLLSIIRFYGGEVSKEYLRELTNTTKEGVSLYNLIEAAKKIGFDAIGVTGKIEDIKVNNLPCIAHININKSYRHFVVIYKIKESQKKLVIMDPAKGKRIISFSEFNLLSSTNYLFLNPIKKIPTYKKKKIISKKVFSTLKINKKNIFIPVLTLNYFILSIITSFNFKYLLELCIEKNISENLLKLTIILCCIQLLKCVLEQLRNILLNKWYSNLNYDLTTSTYEQILLLPYLYFKNRTTGEVLSRFKDLNTLIEFITTLMCTLTTDLISIIIFEIILLRYNIKLTFISNLTLLFIMAYILITNSHKRKIIKNYKISEEVANTYLIQGISNVDTIKGSHLEKRIIDKFKLNYKSLTEKSYEYLKTLERDNFVKNYLKDMMSLIIYSFGSFLVIKEKLSLSSLIIFNYLISFYTSNFLNIVNIISSYNNYKITKDRLEDLYLIETEDFKNNYYYLPYNLSGNIEIHNLYYKIGTKIILNNLSLVIEKGERVLISGESGSGKSTLVKMIMRYIETNYNTIRIANIDINHYHLQNIRSNITYITSNEYLFNDTLKNNICLYKEYLDEEVKKVCNICLVDDIIKSKNYTLDSLIEENGFNLSNGERQRIILARGILRDSTIYILDEALGQIDINREKKILENIFNYLTGKTIIVISHRFNNKKLFDRILKLENGVIIEN